MKLFLNITILLIISVFAFKAQACMCDDSMRSPEKLPAAIDKAAIIFVGKLDGIYWYGEPVTIRKKQPDGTILEITDVIPENAKRRQYNPESHIALPVETEFKVQKVYKDSLKAIKNQKIVIINNNYGMCGFPPKKGELYLVFGRKGHDGKTLYGSQCSRTKLYLEAKDDIDYLNHFFKEVK